MFLVSLVSIVFALMGVESLLRGSLVGLGLLGFDVFWGLLMSLADCAVRSLWLCFISI